MKFLITGEYGYIAGLFKTVLLNTEHEVFYTSIKNINEIVKSLSKNDNTKIDMIIHCGAPGSINGYSGEELTSGIYDNTLALINCCVANNIILLYPGSKVVNEPYDLMNPYQELKIMAQCAINQNLKLKSLILNFPRVYSDDRKKGLIAKLKADTFQGNLNQIMEFADKEFILDQLSDIFDNIELLLKYKTTIELQSNHKITVEDIIRFYKL